MPVGLEFLKTKGEMTPLEEGFPQRNASRASSGVARKEVSF